MKINHKLLIAGIATILLSACRKEYLEKSDPTKIGTETFYKNKTEADQAVNGVYGILQNIGQGQWLLTEQITDNTAVDLDPGNRGNAPSLETFEFMTVTSGNGYLADMYNRTYNGIYNINVALTKIPEADMTEEEKAIDIGQLKFLRGYFYFLLAQYYGDVIVVTEPLVDPAEAYNFQRKPVDTAYALVVQDLTDAVANLPESYPPAELGRATKGAALTLLGKVYLTRKQYPEAQEVLSQVTGLG
ncbi:MAG TPA: RagB/SusD family nutrient uptake outer membrane protein, partial [Flavitalea sp.]|nr:RagB/SusD family nutrient uptake outer membrane protein [Flavitalea sp.]